MKPVVKKATVVKAAVPEVRKKVSSLGKPSPAPSTTEGKKKSWFRTGEEAFKHKKQRDALFEVQRKKGVRRFRLQVGEEANVVFVDSEGFYIPEHQIAPGGSWKDSVYLTCTKEFGELCPVCQAGHKPVFTWYFTVIDMRKFTKKDGTVSTHRRVLMPIKGSAAEVIEELRTENGSLSGLAFKVRRRKDDPNCGREFTKLGKYNIVAKLGKDMAEPYPYEEIMAFPTTEEYEAAGIRAPKSVGSKEDVEAELGDEEEIEDADVEAEEEEGDDIEAQLD